MIWDEYLANPPREMLKEFGLLVLATFREALTWGASLAFVAEAPRSS